jgi:hypothetical protein
MRTKLALSAPARRTLAALTLLAATAIPGAALAAAPHARPHPPVDGEDCAGCHADATPPIQAAWAGSGHGVALVRCFVCHGTTGADFRPRPDTPACRGCHAREVEAAPPRLRAACFDCHDPHALVADPHRAAARRTP